MSVRALRRGLLEQPLLRAGARRCASYAVPLGLAVLMLAGANEALQTASAEGDTRTLSFRHLHTDETITVTFKRDGRYDDAALKKLDWFMRDWRRQESTRMDPKLFDILWEAYREVGGQKPIEVICGYRAPGTNAMLRARSTGVAQNSNHMGGQAIDFAIPGVDLEKLREVGLRLQRGGVGFYPTSGSPFVHMDTGTVRHWPRMTREQLVKVFPDGRTVHVPSDGHPLAGYALALADVERRGNEPNGVSLAAARDAGIVTASADGAKPKRNFLASLFTSKPAAEADELNDDEQARPAKPARPAVALASLTPPIAAKKVTTERMVPLPAARPVALAQVTPTAPNVWNSKVESNELAPLIDAAPVEAQPPFAVASADPTVTATLAYAAETPLPKPALRVKPMGAALSPPPAKPVTPVTATAFALPFAAAVTGGFQKPDSPWLRAVMLAPSIGGALTTTQMGAPHMRPLVDLLYKPAQSLAMTFSADPNLGMTTGRFEGPAVVFVATATFTTQMTASLR